MAILIAVKSCQRDQRAGCHETIRRTWGKHVKPHSLCFFMGGAPEIQGDEITIDCPDDYDSLPHKTQMILVHFLTTGHSHIFLCDTDTYVRVPQLLQTRFSEYDISGQFGGMPAVGTTFNYRDPRGVYPNSHPWPSGGVGYFLSRHAAADIVSTPPAVWAEDMYVGQVLGPLIQKGVRTGANLEDFGGTVAWHYPAAVYGKDLTPMQAWMRKMYSEHP